MAISGFGDAYGLVAASGYGDAYGSLAASGLGNAYSDLVGSFSGTGQAAGGQMAISILGDSYAGVLALSGDGQANSQIAVSILGNATGTGSAAGYPLELSVVDSLVVPVRDLTPGEFEGIYELARVLADTGQYSAQEITAIAVESALNLANGIVPPT